MTSLDELDWFSACEEGLGDMYEGLHDEDVERAEDLPPPEDLAAEIMGNLRVAMDEMEGLMEVLEDDDPTAAEPEPTGLAEPSEAAE